MELANLCKCNNCETILIDQNPQINAEKYILKGGEQTMQYFGGGVKDIEGKSEGYWGCPICLTDGYLKDL
jgi:hypothetical protein